MEERIYTIPLIKAKSVPRIKRAKRAIKEIREFLARHMKVEEVKIDNSLNELVLERGIKKIPSKVKVKAVKIEDVVWAYTPEAEVKVPEKKEKKKKKVERREAEEIKEKEAEEIKEKEEEEKEEAEEEETKEIKEEKEET